MRNSSLPTVSTICHSTTTLSHLQKVLEFASSFKTFVNTANSSFTDQLLETLKDPSKLHTHVVMPLEENLAIWFSKLIPPTPITSIWSAGLFKVLQYKCGAIITIINASQRNNHLFEFNPFIASGRKVTTQQQQQQLHNKANNFMRHLIRQMVSIELLAWGNRHMRSQNTMGNYSTDFTHEQTTKS